MFKQVYYQKILLHNFNTSYIFGFRRLFLLKSLKNDNFKTGLLVKKIQILFLMEIHLHATNYKYYTSFHIS